MRQRVIVTAANFDVAEEVSAFSGNFSVGGIASFVGVVRGDPAAGLIGLEIEHYPGMTERMIFELVAAAESRFDLVGCTVIHRYGWLVLGENIVLVLAASSHRLAALHATEFLIDALKSRAPFWKREVFSNGRAKWVEARQEDEVAVKRWQQGFGGNAE